MRTDSSSSFIFLLYLVRKEEETKDGRRLCRLSPHLDSRRMARKETRVRHTVYMLLEGEKKN